MAAIPVAGEPVTVIASISGLLINLSPTVGPAPCSTFNTPLGKTSCKSSASLSVESGVTSEGFSTTLQPAAIGAASFQDAIING